MNRRLLILKIGVAGRIERKKGKPIGKIIRISAESPTR